jgi:hypothetical protein
MAYLGIGYTGDDPAFLRRITEENEGWLKGDRVPRFFGDRFLVLYDSNTAREFAEKCRAVAPRDAIVVYPMEQALETRPSWCE